MVTVEDIYFEKKKHLLACLSECTKNICTKYNVKKLNDTQGKEEYNYTKSGKTLHNYTLEKNERCEENVIFISTTVFPSTKFQKRLLCCSLLTVEYGCINVKR